MQTATIAEDLATTTGLHRRARHAGLIGLVAVVASCSLGMTSCGGRSERTTATTAPSTAPMSDDERGAPTSTAAPTTTATMTPQCPPVSQQLVAGEGRLTVAGVERPYLLALPDGFDPAVPTPVILAFHGSGSNMTEQAAYSRLPTEGTARGYVVVTPQGAGQPRGWDLAGGDDAAFVDLLLERLSEGMCVDQDRVDAAGISNGSAFAALLACREPYRIAAVGMVGATLADRCPDGVTPAAIAFHGTADPAVPFEGGPVKAEGARGLGVGPAEPSIAGWATHNGCSTDPTEERVGDDVLARTWQDCAGGDVAFYRIEGGGHTWPGPIDVASFGITQLGATSSTVDATTLMLDLFDRSSRTWDRSSAATTAAAPTTTTG